MLEKSLNSRLPYDTLKNYLVDIHPTARSFKIMLDKSRHNSSRFMQDTIKYAKERWGKSHNPPYFELGNLVLVSTLSFNAIQAPKKQKDFFVEPFMIKQLHSLNAV
ncbi:hypothetical protein O181_049165 [Austropuccinia psidii MF-1]|uniref:Uncharacterized protein n=1 Tax=Austropuccinia psidii MF-1 TaxID=1389203 RepID=A0A9Q3DYM4_9BASI|nr:hypothetical protein [Austropuccinia psidii MF-1]